MELKVSNDIHGHYIDNCGKFKNTGGDEDNNKTKYEDFIQWMACLLFANFNYLKYATLENGLEIQYNYQYPKYTISLAGIIKSIFMMVME